MVLVGAGGLVLLLTVPLGWREQTIFGASLIAFAVLLNRLSRSATITLTLMTISVFSTLRYGYWRVVQSWQGITSAGHIHQWNVVFVVMLLLAEFYAFATLILGYFQTLRPLTRQPEPLGADHSGWPTVDVFIPTYNEPLTVVRATVLGALALDYPADKMKVFLLDDGRRPEFQEFAAEVGAGYMTRQTNEHAKAGNINAALERTSGEFVAIFDSDHIPTRSFLQMTLGWFLRDERLGLVQTPHHFYSPDPFERNLGQFRKIPNEGELFHRLVQDGNDLWNASFFCGSCAVLRRTTLQEIGGIAVETVTEDAHTALRMQRRGWNTAYINVPQAAGLATESLSAHIGQRIRWARGMVQILRIENPLLGPGLTLSQRLCYFNATTHFLFALPRLIFLTVPLVYLIFGMVNIYGYSLAVFAYALPHIVLSNVTNSRVQGKYRFSFWNEIYEAVLAPYILMPTLLALINPRLGRFNVTSKGGTVPRSYFDRMVALPFVFLLAVNVAGLFMAERRYVADPAHHDTVIMNTAWTMYNLVILSVAASVARERRQRRSEVRVPVHVPVTLITETNQQIHGATLDVSRLGTAAYLERPVRLKTGRPVVLALNGQRSRCEILARVADSDDRCQHLLFRALDLAQERYLLNLVYLRPKAWVAWDEARPIDRPLRSLLKILGLSLRGALVVPLGLLMPRPRAPGRARGRARASEERAPAAAASIVFALLLSSPAPLHALAAEDATPDARSPQSTMFHDEFELTAMGAKEAVALQGSDATQELFFDVPVTKIVSEATVRLRYSARLVVRNESWLEYWLNGTRVGWVTLVPGADQEAEIVLPTDLLTTDNTIVLRLKGACDACDRARAPWITIAPGSRLSISGSKLALSNDLALLPIPFFDAARQRSWTLPFVFAERPDAPDLEAASAVASWFGVFSDVRGVRFPVRIGELPTGNAVVLVRRGDALAARLALPSNPGPLITVRDNPRDPYGKLLVVAGDRSIDRLAAARALATSRGFKRGSDVVYVKEASVPARREYDAPRWLQSDRPAAIGMYTGEEQLKVRGSGSVNIYFRLAPDLFLPARQSVPLFLKYGYAGVPSGARAALHVRLNGQDVDSIRLKSASGSVEQAEIVQLPTGTLRAYANTLTIDFDFGDKGRPTNVWQYGAIHRDSSIDLRGLPHSVVLPRLELFVDSGYPFTRWPDLGRTAVVMPSAPTTSDDETLLNMVGFFGAQTGFPSTAIAITDANHLQTVRDRDIVVLGMPASQPLLSAWAGAMPLDFTGDGWIVNRAPQPSRWLHPQWPFRGWDRDRLTRLLSSGVRFEVVLEDFVSPIHADRSVVVMVPQTPKNAAAVAALLLPDGRAGPVYGGIAVAREGLFESFLSGTRAYHSGRVSLFQKAKVFLFEYYWLIALAVLVLAVMAGIELRRATERVAARRLAVERPFIRGYQL